MVEDRDTPDAEIIAVREHDVHDIFVALKVNTVYVNKSGEKITHLVLSREDLAKILEARW